jgi:hypothetical protein
MRGTSVMLNEATKPEDAFLQNKFFFITTKAKQKQQITSNGRR